MSGSVLDLVVVVILILEVLRGIVEGVIKEGVKYLSMILAIVIALLVAEPITNAVYTKLGGRERMVVTMQNTLHVEIQEQVNNAEVKMNENTPLPDEIVNKYREMLDRINIGSILHEGEIYQGVVYTVKGFSEKVVSIIEPVILKGIKFVVVLVIFVIGQILLNLALTVLLKPLKESYTIKTLDKVLGGILGFFSGVILTGVGLAICYVLVLFDLGGRLLTQATLNGSKLFGLLSVL